MPFLLLMPSYNQASYIQGAVDSCLAQADPDWELWILDNSSDDTPERMRPYQDARIHFIHEPRRMDPGTCVNELLRQTKGEYFSYIHTDNRLLPNYVSAFRRALEGQGQALAYCDHWTIDRDGRRTGLERRLNYGLGSLLGGHGLGVPFAATRTIAEATGGFPCDDLADDVLFCDRAWGLGQWTYIRQPLMEYRVHQDSRTAAGGASGVLQAILRAHEMALPVLEARGYRPLEAMQKQLSDLVLDMESAAMGIWMHRVGPDLPTWWKGNSWLDPIWRAGLVRLPNFGSRAGGPASFPKLGSDSPVFRWPWLKVLLSPLQVEINRIQPQFRSLVLGLGYLTARRAGVGAPGVQAGSHYWANRWAVHYLEKELGWSCDGQPGSMTISLEQLNETVSGGLWFKGGS